MRLIKNSSGTYSVSLQTEHGRRRMTTGATDKKEAQRIVKEAKVQELENTAKSIRLSHSAVSQLLSGRKVTMAAVIPEYTCWMRTVSMSERSIATAIQVLTAWTKDEGVMALPPALVTEKQVSDWVNRPGDRKLSTRIHNLSVISSMMAFCSAKGYSSGNPAKLVRVDLSLLTHEQKEKKVRAVIAEEEFYRLLEGSKELVEPEFWRSALMLGYHAGLRISDICLLEWKSIEVPGKLIVWTRKSDARVDVPVHPELAAELAKVNRKGTSKYVWPQAASKMLGVSTRAYFSKTFARLCDYCAVKGVSFHCLRHTYATEMSRLGVPTPHISSRLGHAHGSTTEGYIHR